MNIITAIIVAVVVLLTGIVFILAWFVYRACLKAYKLEVNQGKYDAEICNEFNKKQHKTALSIFGNIISYIIIIFLLILFIIGLSYRVSGDNLTVNNKTILVIKSGSMSGYYNNEIAAKYDYDTSLQFDIGDICIFETDFDLVEGEVYGYKYNNYIITHRLVSMTEYSCRFRGDANAGYDAKVAKDSVIYHYTGNKIPKIGLIILYAQSYFGIWSLISIIGILVLSEIANVSVNKVNKERLDFINSIGEGSINEK